MIHLEQVDEDVPQPVSMGETLIAVDSYPRHNLMYLYLSLEEYDESTRLEYEKGPFSLVDL